ATPGAIGTFAGPFAQFSFRIPTAGVIASINKISVGMTYVASATARLNTISVVRVLNFNQQNICLTNPSTSVLGQNDNSASSVNLSPLVVIPSKFRNAMADSVADIVTPCDGTNIPGGAGATVFTFLGLYNPSTSLVTKVGSATTAGPQSAGRRGD